MQNRLILMKKWFTRDGKNYYSKSSIYLITDKIAYKTHIQKYKLKLEW